MFRTLKSLLRAESGVTAMEYGVIAAAIVVALVAAMPLVATALTNTFGSITNAL